MISHRQDQFVGCRGLDENMHMHSVLSTYYYLHARPMAGKPNIPPGTEEMKLYHFVLCNLVPYVFTA